MNNYDEFKDVELATTHLSSHLMDGTLVLFLGAGVSKSFGLLSWQELIDTLRESVGLPKTVGSASAEDLQRAADDVLDKVGTQSALINLIQEKLYKDLITLTTA